MPNIVVNDITPRIQYVASNGQTVFVFPFLMFYPTDINVYRRAAISVPVDPLDILTYNLDYTVSINPPPAVGGTITLLTPAVGGDIITLVRNQPDQRLNYYIQGGPFTANMVNFDFDQIVLMDQQRKMYDEVAGIHYNLNAVINPGVDNYLPILPANHVWCKNDQNNAIETRSLPASPVGSVGGNFGNDMRLVRTNIDGGLNNIEQVGIECTDNNVLQSVAGNWGLNSANDLNINAVNNVVIKGQTFPAVAGSVGAVMALIAPGVLGYVNVPTTPDASIPNRLVKFINTFGGIDDSVFEESGTNLLLPADPTVPLAAATKQYVDAQTSGSVVSVLGTANQVTVDNTDPNNPVISLPSTLILPGTIAFGNILGSGNTISSTNTNGNISLIPNGTGEVLLKADPVAPLAAATKQYVDAAGNAFVESVSGTTNEITVDNTDPQNPIVKLASNVSSALAVINGMTNGQLLIGNPGSNPTANTLTAGTGISIVNAAGTITINATGGGGGFPASVQVLTSSTTWIRPVGITKIMVEIVGGGGGGGGSAPTAGGGGGGGGAYSKKFIASPSASEIVTIGTGGGGGAGGNPGAAGTGGGTTSFGSIFSAAGGGGGQSALDGGAGSPGGGGVGANATGGDINLVSNGGGAGTNNAGGTGGGSIFGGGAPGPGRNSSAQYPGGQYGAGGSGGRNTSVVGGAGANGVCVVWEYN